MSSVLPPSMKPLWIRWWPAIALDGMTDLTAMEELAYRRILDLIFKSDDRLRDDDQVMPTATKTGRQWKAIKQALIAKGKVAICDGYIRNARATETCIETRDFRAQKKAAAEASHSSGKRLKNKQTTSAVAEATADTTASAVAGASKQLPTEEGVPPSSGGAAASGGERGEQIDLFREPLTDFASLMGESRDACRSKLAALRKAAKGDDGLVVRAIEAARQRIEAGEALLDPFPWMMRGIAKRLQASAKDSTPPPPLPEQVGACHIPTLLMDLDNIFERAAKAAGARVGICINGLFPNFDRALVEVLREGADAERHLVPVITMAGRRYGRDGWLPERTGWWPQEFRRQMTEGRRAA